MYRAILVGVWWIWCYWTIVMDLLLLALELGIGVWCNWTIAALICWLVLTLFAQEVAINLAEVFGVVHFIVLNNPLIYFTANKASFL